jgi:hypothetical protein
MKRTYTLELAQEDRIGAPWHAQLLDARGTAVAVAIPGLHFGVEAALDQVVDALIVRLEEHGQLPPDGR